MTEAQGDTLIEAGGVLKEGFFVSNTLVALLIAVAVVSLVLLTVVAFRRR